MEFFDRKQEVIDIKLTQYGKMKLSEGKFRPSYYAFFDNDVIYDTNHGENGYEEVQKESEDRIKSALRPKAQTITYGLESIITKLLKGSQAKEDQGLVASAINETLYAISNPPPNKLNNDTLVNPLGTSDLNSFYTPYWNLNSLVGEVKTSSANYTGSLDIERIPQVNIDIFYDTFINMDNIENLDEDDSLQVDKSGQLYTLTTDAVDIEYNDTSGYAPRVYDDGSKIVIRRGFSLIDLIEGYTKDNIENFDIEVFQVKTEKNNGIEEEHLQKMKFRNNQYLKLNGNQLFSPELTNSIQIDSSYVEYYFEIKFDNEIEDVVRSFAPDIDAVSELPENNFEEPCED